MVVAVAGQISTASPILVMHPDPQVVLVGREGLDDPVNSIEGGYWLNITGDGFGLNAGDLRGVLVGGREADATEWLSPTRISALVPSGVGSGLDVVAIRRDGGRSNAGQFSYEDPEITAVEPPYLLAGVGNVSVELVGSNLGMSPEDIADASVGGYRCAALTEVSPGRVVCRLTTVDDWYRSEVEITTKFGRSFTFDDVFTGLPAPVVTYVDPAEASAGSTVVFTGRDFTRTGSTDGQEDIQEVTIGGVPVDGFEVLTSSTISAVVPRGVGKDLEIAVVSSTGRESAVPAAFAYSPPIVSQLYPRYIFGGEAQARLKLTV